MGFMPRIDVVIANNRCHCCDDDPVKPQPKELAVFFKDGKFRAKLDRNDFSSIYSGLVTATRRAIHDFLANHYQLNSDEIPDGFRAILDKRLPSLEEVYDIEKVAHGIFSSKSGDSLDRSHTPSPNKKLTLNTP